MSWSTFWRWARGDPDAFEPRGGSEPEMYSDEWVAAELRRIRRADALATVLVRREWEDYLRQPYKPLISFDEPAWPNEDK